MATGRFLSRSVAVNRQLRGVSLAADFLFTRMLPHLDRDGRMEGDPDVVRATACPVRKEFTTDTVEGCLVELADAKLIVRYVSEGQHVILFPQFHVHQRGMKYNREAPSRLPAPPESALDPDSLRQSSGSTPTITSNESGSVPEDFRLSEVKRSEENVSEVKLTQVSSSSSSSTTDICEFKTHFMSRLASDVQRDAVEALMGSQRCEGSSFGWYSYFGGLLDGLGSPGGKAATPHEIASTASELIAQTGFITTNRFSKCLAVVIDRERNGKKRPTYTSSVKPNAGAVGYANATAALEGL